MAEVQENDEFINVLRLRLLKLPVPDSLKKFSVGAERVLKKLSKKCCVDEGIVYFVDPLLHCKRLFLPRLLLQNLAQLLHGGPTAAHFGFDKVYAHLRERYILRWNGGNCKKCN